MRVLLDALIVPRAPGKATETRPQLDKLCFRTNDKLPIQLNPKAEKDDPKPCQLVTLAKLGKEDCKYLQMGLRFDGVVTNKISLDMNTCVKFFESLVHRFHTKCANCFRFSVRCRQNS